MAEIRGLTAILLFSFMTLQLDAVKVTCPSSSKTNYCKMEAMANFTSITRISQDNKDICELDNAFGVVMRESQYNVWVEPGCGGEFDVRGLLDSSPYSATVTWGAWGEWGSCSVTCGGGTQTRRRSYSPGEGALWSLVDDRDCNMEACPNTDTDGDEDSNIKPWGGWTACSVSCGGGTQSRSRIFSNGPNSQFALHDIRRCNEEACSPTIQWNAWGDWSECSASCGGGTQTRSKTASSGPNASWSISENRDCNTDPCSSNVQWNMWGDWSECSVSCGGGTQMRSKTASNSLFSSWSVSESRDCNTEACSARPVQWSPWGEWGECSVSCGGGTQSRTRSYSNGPNAQYYLKDVRPCNVEACQSGSSNAQWSEWGTWGACSASCGGGSQSRSRSLSTGPNANWYISENRDCNTASCSSNIQWTEWGDWSACSASCGGGTQTRSRTASDSSKLSEDQNCNTEACPGTEYTQPATCGQVPNTRVARLVGGEVADNCEFPWMVLVYAKERGSMCGGAILDKTHIMTAAHCVIHGDDPSKQDEPDDLTVLTGTSEMPFSRVMAQIPGLTMRTVSHIKAHEEYNSYSLANDIAIITLSEPIEYDRCHVPVCLATGELDPVGTTCIAMGWGKTGNLPQDTPTAHLKHADVRVHEASECGSIYGPRAFSADSNLCVGGDDSTGTCKGDSGGPLICQQNGRYYSHGIVSGGAKGLCGEVPSIFTKISHFMDWIATNTR